MAGGPRALKLFCKQDQEAHAQESNEAFFLAQTLTQSDIKMGTKALFEHLSHRESKNRMSDCPCVAFFLKDAWCLISIPLQRGWWPAVTSFSQEKPEAMVPFGAEPGKAGQAGGRVASSFTGIRTHHHPVSAPGWEGGWGCRPRCA